jgi:hypothetical protein
MLRMLLVTKWLAILRFCRASAIVRTIKHRRLGATVVSISALSSCHYGCVKVDLHMLTIF